MSEVAYRFKTSYKPPCHGQNYQGGGGVRWFGWSRNRFERKHHEILLIILGGKCTVFSRYDNLKLPACLHYCSSSFKGNLNWIFTSLSAATVATAATATAIWGPILKVACLQRWAPSEPLVSLINRNEISKYVCVQF